MEIPSPVPALVIRYAYLWAEEHEAGREEGVKERPCAVLLAVEQSPGRVTAVVLPITHASPPGVTDAVEIPPATKRRLGLDDERSWIVTTEVNVFAWPGPDVRPVSPDAETIAYGLLPAKLFEDVKQRFAANVRNSRIRQVPRTE